MIPTFKTPYRDGELRIGWASWDDGSYTHRSIKYAYPDASGKISRGSPELPFDILVDMLLKAAEQNELKNLWYPESNHSPKLLGNLTKAELDEERKQVAATLTTLQLIAAKFPWVDWKNVYNALGNYYEAIKSELTSH